MLYPFRGERNGRGKSGVLVSVWFTAAFDRIIFQTWSDMIDFQSDGFVILLPLPFWCLERNKDSVSPGLGSGWVPQHHSDGMCFGIIQDYTHTKNLLISLGLNFPCCCCGNACSLKWKTNFWKPWIIRVFFPLLWAFCRVTFGFSSCQFSSCLYPSETSLCGWAHGRSCSSSFPGLWIFLSRQRTLPECWWKMCLNLDFLPHQRQVWGFSTSSKSLPTHAAWHQSSYYQHSFFSKPQGHVQPDQHLA